MPEAASRGVKYPARKLTVVASNNVLEEDFQHHVLISPRFGHKPVNKNSRYFFHWFGMVFPVRLLLHISVLLATWMGLHWNNLTNKSYCGRQNHE